MYTSFSSLFNILFHTMGNTNSTEGSQSLNSHQQSEESMSTSLPTITTVEHVLDNQEELPPSAPPNEPVAVPTTTKSKWVSSTGGSPWYGSLSSSTSSHHRASISGPYYRTRGMSVTRDSENDEDLNPPTASSPPLNTGVPTIITWTQGGNNVYITGTFNGWKHKIKLVKSTHDFSAVLELPVGTHRLKFIVDDEWKCSNDMETATDPDGNLVNYLQVMEDEEEDSVSMTSSVSEEYTNEIPVDLWSSEDASKMKQPPSLPPHLEKVLLNSQTVSEEDNSVLQEPNHVTLNHLYACSIKDNVMALATTSRYRKKVNKKYTVYV
ncbi:hypothetical protein BDB01DRAFT_765131 [Pilobolus umbonatus]|nr:hypothetical protein BDB01DRAFT_765131 [Pilobolus umbonatus]